jgi:hypothetical protein
MSCLFPGAARPAQNVPAGVIQQTQSARLNQTDASIGTTLYDGDRLEAQSKGTVNVRSNQILLTLAEDSLLWMNHDNGVLAPKLDRGTVIFRAETGEGIEIHADDVRVRPHAAVLTVGQVTIDNCYVVVTARTQSLEVSAVKDSNLLKEGKSYRVTRLGSCGALQTHPPAAVGQSRFYIGAAAIVGTVAALAVSEALESPDRP